jgi:hypothetical protein
LRCSHANVNLEAVKNTKYSYRSDKNSLWLYLEYEIPKNNSGDQIQVNGYFENENENDTFYSFDSSYVLSFNEFDYKGLAKALPKQVKIENLELKDIEEESELKRIENAYANTLLSKKPTKKEDKEELLTYLVENAKDITANTFKNVISYALSKNDQDFLKSLSEQLQNNKSSKKAELALIARQIQLLVAINPHCVDNTYFGNSLEQESKRYNFLSLRQAIMKNLGNINEENIYAIPNYKAENLPMSLQKICGEHGINDKEVIQKLSNTLSGKKQSSILVDNFIVNSLFPGSKSN